MEEPRFLFMGVQMLSNFVSEESLSFAQKFLVKDDDVIIVSYPRSGTHWMIEILSLIVSKGDPTWVQTVSNNSRCPGIESKDWQYLLLNQDQPRIMSTHLPIQLFPNSYFTSSAKIIYVIRNPRDVATSLYHMRKKMQYLSNQITFDEYLHRFMQGNVPYGSWFDHTLGWLTRRDTENFLLISYEELQMDLRGNIQKLCQFLGKHLTPQQIDSAIHSVSFSVMKENRMSNSVIKREDENTFHIPLLRKGICGDWKNHFTVAQSEAFDKVYEEKMSGLDSGLLPWFKHC